MASALRRFSEYPLVLLTNRSRFPDGTDVASSLRRLNVDVRAVQHVPAPDSLLHENRVLTACRDTAACAAQYMKLQIWRLTEYEKLIWMDTDAILTRSVDQVFHLKGTWAQQDNWDCGSQLAGWLRWSGPLTRLLDGFRTLVAPTQRQESSGVCSGMLLIEPSEATYKGIVGFLGTLSSAPGGDQEVVERYFRDVKKEPVQLLDLKIASFGQCQRMGYLRDTTPAFVHKSDRDNACFRVAAESAECQGNPLGQYWRGAFCEAVATARIQDTSLRSFCSPRTAH